MVTGDANRLKQVIQNFLSNACKFTPQGGCVTVQVELLDRTDESLHVKTSVTDTGPGVGDSEKERIFRPWSQLREGAKSGTGSGLGLALSKDFIEKGFRGLIGLTSSPSGATFYFEIDFPIAVKSVGESGHVEEIRDVSVVVKDVVAEKKVLPEGVQVEYVDVAIVDDSIVNRKLLTKILNQFGISCHSFSNGQEAVDQLTGKVNPMVKCQLVLMDKEMPVMDGHEATKALRASGTFQGHIVGVTGNAMDAQVSEFISYGAEEVITKPVKSKRIEQLLRQHGLLPNRSTL
jgi:CheY-like chemotaxis protein